MHVRFEDDFTKPAGDERHYAVGITLQHFSLRTCDEQWDAAGLDITKQGMFSGAARYVRRNQYGDTTEPLRREFEVRHAPPLICLPHCAAGC